MSANGVFAAALGFTLDGEGDVKIVAESYGAVNNPITPTFQGSAINIVDGQLNSSLDFSLYAESKVRIGSFASTVDYTAAASGKTLVNGGANNLIISFSPSGTEGDIIVEGEAAPVGTITFGVAASASVLVAATSQPITEFTSSSAGEVIVKGIANVPLDFTTNPQTEGDVLVEDTGAGAAIGFTLDGEGDVIITGGAAATFNITNEFAGRHVYPIFPKANNEISFTLASTGQLPNHGRLNLSYSFDFSGRLAQFSLGDGGGSIGFTFKGKGVNVTEHIYSRDGVNGLAFIGNGYNGVTINQPDNGVKLLANGTTDVKLLR